MLPKVKQKYLSVSLLLFKILGDLALNGPCSHLSKNPVCVNSVPHPNENFFLFLSFLCLVCPKATLQKENTPDSKIYKIN